MVTPACSGCSRQILSQTIRRASFAPRSFATNSRPWALTTPGSAAAPVNTCRPCHSKTRPFWRRSRLTGSRIERLRLDAPNDGVAVLDDDLLGVAEGPIVGLNEL